MNPHVTDAQRVKLAQRLSLNPDRADCGQLLTRTAEALARPCQTPLEQAERAAALAASLVEERLIVPVPVESHAEANRVHQPFTGEGDFPLPTAPHGETTAVLAFTSAHQLSAWQANARPTPLSAQKAAVAATQLAAPAAILVDPASPDPVVLPVGAIHALIGADVWLPPWRDEALHEEILRTSHQRCPEVTSVKVSPFAQPGQNWDGTLQVELRCYQPGGHRAVDAEQHRRAITDALAAVGTLSRLRNAAPRLVLTPVPVVLA